MNIRDLEAFVAVVETGSIVGASTRLSLTQPGVTRRIQNLEDQLDVALLDRQSKPLKPTAVGRAAYDHGRRVLRALDDFKTGVSPHSELQGEFRLGVMPYLSAAALTLPVDRLRSEFPDLSLRVTSGWSPALLDQVTHGALDAVVLCLAEGAPVPDHLAGDALGTEEVLLIASPRLNVPKPASLPDLARFPWVMNESGCGFRAFIRHRFEALGLPFQVAVEALSADLRMSLVARGLGIGVVTPAAFADSPWRDQVEIVDARDFRPRVQSWVIYRPPLGRLAEPVSVLRESLLAGQERPVPLVSDGG
ncbi:MAG TPA: LysR family transcriptional regulator [Castellaniella sp.]|nr:LysR family transcriptional regulator [Castellaniella sp.]